MSTIDAETLEAALTGAPGADPELSALVRDVRAEAPVMASDFAARLDERVAALPAQAPRWRPLLSPRRLLPVFAAAALLACAAVATVTLRDGGRAQPLAGLVGEGSSDEGSAGSSSASRAAPPSAHPAARLRRAGGGARKSYAADAAPTRDLQALTRDLQALSGSRKVQRDAELTLTTSRNDVQDVADRVVSTTQDIDGVVARSSVDVGDAQGSASFTLRIPTRRLDDGLKRLSDLAHVGSLRQGSTDITGSFVSAADRLSDARAERRALLKALGKATTPNAIASLRSRIRFNRSEIAALKGDLQALRRRADLATVSVQVVGRGAAKGAAGGNAGWTPGDAAHDALRVLEVGAGVLLIAVAVAAPLGALALLVVLATGAARRRRREHTLDAA